MSAPATNELEALLTAERARNTALRARFWPLHEAASAVLSNEEHAVSSGARKYGEGSQTWQVYKDLKMALLGVGNTSTTAAPAPPYPLTEHGKGAAVATLLSMGYTYHGGELWKPPIVKLPAWLVEPAPSPQAEPPHLTMSMFANKADFDASKAKQAGIVGWFDTYLNCIRWRDGLRNGDIPDGAPLYIQTTQDADSLTVPITATDEITCAIEAMIDQQLTASSMKPGHMHRQDGSRIWDAAIAAIQAKGRTP